MSDEPTITHQALDENAVEAPKPVSILAPTFMVWDDADHNSAAILVVHDSPSDAACARMTVSARGHMIDLELSDHDAGVMIAALQERRK